MSCCLAALADPGPRGGGLRRQCRCLRRGEGRQAKGFAPIMLDGLPTIMVLVHRIFGFDKVARRALELCQRQEGRLHAPVRTWVSSPAFTTVTRALKLTFFCL